MNHFFLDASALVKRYLSETGNETINFLIDELLTASAERLIVSQLGIAEAISVLNRRRNRGQITDVIFTRGSSSVLSESKLMVVEVIGLDVIPRSISLISSHNLNASDALYLQQMLDWQVRHDSTGDRIVLVATDRRPLRAAEREGLEILNPEQVGEAEVDTFIEP